MTLEDQRVAIAVHCGHPEPFYLSNEYEETGGMDGDSCFVDVLRDANDRRVPDYLNDLNAMHFAEEKLTWEQGGKLNEWLFELLPINCHIYHATAKHRAGALLRTIGKWK